MQRGEGRWGWDGGSGAAPGPGRASAGSRGSGASSNAVSFPIDAAMEPAPGPQEKYHLITRNLQVLGGDRGLGRPAGGDRALGRADRAQGRSWAKWRRVRISLRTRETPRGHAACRVGRSLGTARGSAIQQDVVLPTSSPSVFPGRLSPAGCVSWPSTGGAGGG